MKIKSILSPSSKLPLCGIVLITLATLLMAGCSEPAEPKDTVYPAQDFSIDLETYQNQIRANLIVSNPGDSEFPGDRDFEGKMSLWNESGESVGWAESNILSAIGSGESTGMGSFSWDLDPGVYFMTWGEPEYGGALSIFFVANNLSGVPEVVREQSFQTKPADYGADFNNSGSIDTFTLTADGSMIVSGESPLPDQSCLFPLIYSWKGLVEGYPLGECVQIADGHWQLEVPADPESDGIRFEEDNSYRVIVFSQDLRVPPSEPFEIIISPPVQE